MSPFWILLELRLIEVEVTTPPTNQHSAFFWPGQMPFLQPNQQCQSTEGKVSHSMDILAHPELI